MNRLLNPKSAIYRKSLLWAAANVFSVEISILISVDAKSAENRGHWGILF